MRESIWSISPRWKTTYFFLFNMLCLLGTGLLSWYETTQRAEDSAVETVLAIISGMAEVGVAAAVATIVTTEVIQNVMVTGEYLRQKLVEPLKEKQRAEGRAKGRAEGLAEGLEKGREAERAAWEAWNRRRMDAESKGEPFDEPPPSLRENSSNGSNGS
jgi:hypothetical protein